MNKINIFLKNFLALILIFLNIKYINLYGIIGTPFVIYLILLGIMIISLIKDDLNKFNNKIYNYLFIFVEFILIFIFIRTFYDPSFIYNSSYYMDLLDSSFYDTLKFYNEFYFYQNIYFFIVLITLLLIYHKINNENKSKYNKISIICLILSIYSIIHSLNSLVSYDFNILLYLLFTIILICVEIYLLYKNIDKKHNWIIFISFIFNYFTIILIIVNFLLY